MTDTPTYDLYVVIASEDGIGVPKAVYQMSSLAGTLAGTSDFQRMPPVTDMPFNQRQNKHHIVTLTSALQSCLDKAVSGHETFSQFEVAWQSAWQKLSEKPVSQILSILYALAHL